VLSLVSPVSPVEASPPNNRGTDHDGTPNVSGLVTSGLSVVFNGPVASVTAEHYSVGTGTAAPTAWSPKSACLTLVDDDPQARSDSIETTLNEKPPTCRGASHYAA